MLDTVSAVRTHIENAYSGIDSKKFSQEPAYVAALMARLGGLAWTDHEGAYIEFATTVVNDRGPNSAENKFGADFAITLDLMNEQGSLKKATIGQAKRGSTENLSKKDMQNLKEQCQKMAGKTSEYLVLETPTESRGCPMIRLSSKTKNSRLISDTLIRLDDYIIEHLIACSHGDKRNDFVEAVQQSNLEGLEVTVSGLDKNLIPDHTPRSPTRGP